MALLKKQLRSFTLIETLVALVLVMLSFGLAMLLFTQVEQARKTTLQMKTALAMEEIAAFTKNEAHYLDDRLDYEAFYIEKKCYPYLQGSNAVVLILSAHMRNGQFLNERKEIICIQPPTD
jgi:Tfp pilus assembly protein PilV